MEKLTLVILAAGMGSRYGGLKQLDPMTVQGATIIDFSVFDAIQAGFSKVIFIIRKSFKEEFEQLFDQKLKDTIEVSYVCQELDTIPKEFLNEQRVKPWGTGHALLTAKDEIGGNFAVVNADDFYGKEAFVVMANALKKEEAKDSNFYMIGYPLKNTISEHGSVSRGQCYLKEDGILDTIIERTHIEKMKGKLYYKDQKEMLCFLEDDTIVSMNFWGFTPKIFAFLEREFLQFLQEHSKEETAEFYIPFLVDRLIQKNKADVSVLTTDSSWLGVTYKEDKSHVVAEISKLIKSGEYPEQLW